MNSPDIHVGSRIIIADRYTATIRYLGPIDGQLGDWAGLEWDDHSRGKHDGSHNGKRYFTCPSNAGSFVRLPKLLETSDFGCSLFHALQTRYFPHFSNNDNNNTTPTTTSTTTTTIQIHGGRELEVEVKGSGATALITTNNVHQAALVNCHISHLHNDNHQSMPTTIDSQLTSALMHLQELDLSDNLLSSWEFINALLHTTPQLKVLNITGNKLGTVFPPPPSSATAWKGKLQTLVVNKCGLNWRDLVALGQWFPHLVSLHACDNGIRHLRVTEKENEEDTTSSPLFASLSPQHINNSILFPDLQLLDLEHNQLDNWEDILHCIIIPGGSNSGIQTSPMPALRSLLLSHNNITHISPIDTSTTAHHSSQLLLLSTLMLGSNQLSSWHSIDALNTFPHLSDLRISDNPLTPTFSSSSSSSYGGDLRYETIARLGRVLRLNGSDVSRGERRDAEIIYLKKIIDAMAAVSVSVGDDDTATATATATAAAAAAAASSSSSSTIESLKAQHPRYDELVKIYGHLTAGKGSTNNSHSSGALSGNLVTVQLTLQRNTRSTDDILTTTEKQLSKRLPLTMTVSKLKVMIDKLLGVKPARQGLVLFDSGNGSGGTGQGEEEGEDITQCEDRELRYYGVTEGSRVCVIECDPEERNDVMMKERIQGMKKQREREVEHERMLQRLKGEEVRLLGR
jgi:tubulin-specific chaperone E